MLRIFFIFVCLSIVVNECKTNHDIAFIANFLKYKHITLANFYTCGNIKLCINVIKQFYMYSLRISIIKNFSKRNRLNYFFQRFAFIIDLSCSDWQLVLRQKLKETKYRIQWYGLLLCKNENQFSIVKRKLKFMNLRLDSNIFVALKVKAGYHMHEFYNVGYNNGSELNVYNSINYTEGYIATNSLSTYAMRKNLSSLHLRVAFVVTQSVSQPLEYLKDVRTKQYDTSSKVNFGIFGHMIDIHKYKWELKVTPAWFSSNRHGTDIGLANVLTQNIADISGSSGIMTPGRAEAFDFGVATYLFRSSFIYRSPIIYEEDMAKSFILKPFTPGTWICTLVFIAILCIVMKVMLHFERGMLRRNPYKCSWCTILMFVISFFCQQVMRVPQNSIASRILILTSLILTFILYNYYTSSIVSSIINSKNTPFESLAELINSKLDLGMERIAFARISNTSSDPLLSYLNKEARSNNSHVTFHPEADGIGKIREGKFAYLAESVTAYDSIEKSFTNEEICDLMEVNAARPTLLYIVGKKNGQYNKLFSISYRRITQYGLLQRVQKIFLDDKPQCLNSIQFVQVRFEQVLSALILLIIGYGISLVILFIEIIHKKW